MDQLKERLAYLKGLAAGLDIQETTREGKLMAGVIQVLDSMVKSIGRLQAEQQHLEEYVEAIDEDLDDLELGFWDGYEVEDDENADTTMGDYFELECPNCHETVLVDQDVFDDEDVVEVLCPECRETILMNDAVSEYDDHETDDDVESLV